MLGLVRVRCLGLVKVRVSQNAFLGVLQHI